MKLKKLIFILFLIPLLGGCGTNREYKQAVSLNLDWYIIGYGSFINGKNWDIASGVKFNKIDANNYQVSDIEFSIGDCFRIVSGDYAYTLDTALDLSHGSFKSKNAILNNDKDIRIDVTRSGSYSFDLTIDENINANLKMNNGQNTPEGVAPLYQGNVDIDFYADGDHHGVVFDYEEGYYKYPSIARYIAYLKHLMEQSNNGKVLISNGDLWQETYESNFNKGALLNEVLDTAGYDVLTVGNHEFDWQEHIIANNQGILKNLKFLGANIVDRDTEVIKDYVQPYKIVERNGIRIGIIGTIGKDQITAITSSNVANTSFIDHVDVVKKYSDVLRTRFNCELVVASVHTQTKALDKDSLVEISPVSKKRYVDAMFTAHDHAYTQGEVDGVPYINSGAHGTNVSHFTLTYSSTNGVSYSDLNNYHYSGGEGTGSILRYPEEDAATLTTVNKYITPEIKDKMNEIVGEVDNNFSKAPEAPRLMAKAIYDMVEADGYNIDIALVNNARAILPKGEISFSTLFNAFPFTNETIILDIKGQDLSRFTTYYYYAKTPFNLVTNKTYKIATYDYLCFHQNSKRNYDYFSHSLPFNIYQRYGDFYPVDIAADYMKAQKDVIQLDDYCTINYTFLA